VEIQRVDPRTARRELYEPVYRVYFWGVAMASYEYELTGASDVGEVLRWAEENRGDRTYAVYVVWPVSGSAAGIARVYGSDPTRRD
jgi:hypothetical protein